MPTVRLNSPLNEVKLSKPTEKQASETEWFACNSCMAFAIRTDFKYWCGVLPYMDLKSRMKWNLEK